MSYGLLTPLGKRKGFVKVGNSRVHYPDVCSTPSITSAPEEEPEQGAGEEARIEEEEFGGVASRGRHMSVQRFLCSAPCRRMEVWFCRMPRATALPSSSLNSSTTCQLNLAEHST